MPLAKKLRDEAVLYAATLRKELEQLAIEKQILAVSPMTDQNDVRRVEVAGETIRAEEGLWRLSQYNPEIQRPFDCPYCWIIHGDRVRLEQVPGPTEAIACPSCAAHIALDR